MPPRPALDSLQRLAEFGADAASREVGQRLHRLRNEEERLHQINDYLQHYERLAANAGQALSVGMITDRRRFTDRLREAARQQQKLVVEEERRYQQQLARWREARAQALSLQRFNERRREEADEQLARREQRQLDEIGLRRTAGPTSTMGG